MNLLSLLDVQGLYKHLLNGCSIYIKLPTYKYKDCFLLEREWNEMTSMMPVSLLVVYRYIDGSHVKFF